MLAGFFLFSWNSQLILMIFTHIFHLILFKILLKYVHSCIYRNNYDYRYTNLSMNENTGMTYFYQIIMSLLDFCY